LKEAAVSSTRGKGAVVALAGRRIDAEGTVARFPFDQVERVAAEISGHLRKADATALVCSAACGADLIGLGIAQDMGLRTRIILPFARSRFRATSVVDRPRPDYWGALFDSVTDSALACGDLVELDFAEGDDTAYSAANVVIIDEARRLAGAAEQGSPALVALVIWEGGSRGSGDTTHQFAELARSSGFQIDTILTIDSPTGRA
jgi:hypothetical protein